MKNKGGSSCKDCTITLCLKCKALSQYIEFDSWLESVSLVKIKKAPVVCEDGECTYGRQSRES